MRYPEKITLGLTARQVAWLRAKGVVIGESLPGVIRMLVQQAMVEEKDGEVRALARKVGWTEKELLQLYDGNDAEEIAAALERRGKKAWEAVKKKYGGVVKDGNLWRHERVRSTLYSYWGRIVRRDGVLDKRRGDQHLLRELLTGALRQREPSDDPEVAAWDRGM